MNQVKDNIAYTCGKTMEIYGPMIEQQITNITGRQELSGKPFQILGFDLLIDRNLKAWILEVNDHPSLDIYFDNSMSMQKSKKTDDDICEVDLFVKSRLVHDTILLAKKSRDTLSGLQQFKSLAKVHPIEREDGEDMYSLVCNLRQVFLNITPIRNKSQVSAQMFEKLFNKREIKSKGI